MDKEIKGIFEIEGESDIFDNADIIDTIGIQVSFEWELDSIRISLSDKKGHQFGILAFDSTEFQARVSDIMPPTTKKELEEQDKEMAKLTPEELKELEKDTLEDCKEMHKNPIKAEIKKYHGE